MRWPWRRDRGESEDGVEQQPSRSAPVPDAPGGAPDPRPPEAGWASLPPVQRTIPSLDLITRPLAFPEELPVRADPRFTGPLAHVVDPRAPAGLVDGDGGRLGSPTVDDRGPELTLPPPRAHRPGDWRAVQRTARAAPERPASPLVSSPEPGTRARPVEAVAEALEVGRTAEVAGTEVEVDARADAAGGAGADVGADVEVERPLVVGDAGSATDTGSAADAGSPTTASGPLGAGAPRGSGDLPVAAPGLPGAGQRGGARSGTGPGERAAGQDVGTARPAPEPVVARLRDESKPLAPDIDAAREAAPPEATEPAPHGPEVERAPRGGDLVHTSVDGGPREGDGDGTRGPGDGDGATGADPGDSSVDRVDVVAPREPPVRRLGLGAPLAGLPVHHQERADVQRRTGLTPGPRPGPASLAAAPGGEAYSDGQATYVPLTGGPRPATDRPAGSATPVPGPKSRPAPPGPQVQRSTDAPTPPPEPAARYEPAAQPDRSADAPPLPLPATRPLAEHPLPSSGGGDLPTPADADAVPTVPILSAAWAAQAAPAAITGPRQADAGPASPTRPRAPAPIALQRAPASRPLPLVLPASGHPAPTVAEAPAPTAEQSLEAPPAVQRAVEAPAPAPAQADAALPPSATGAPGSPDQLDELARRLAGPILARVKAELLVERERRGVRTDAGWGGAL